MDDALVTGVMAGAVLSATLTQGFRLWRARHTTDPPRERRAAGATWLLVLAIAVVVANAQGSPGALGDVLLMVPAGAALGLHPRVPTPWGVVAVVLAAVVVGIVQTALTPGRDPASVTLLVAGGVLGVMAATTAADRRLGPH